MTVNWVSSGSGRHFVLWGNTYWHYFTIFWEIWLKDKSTLKIAVSCSPTSNFKVLRKRLVDDIYLGVVLCFLQRYEVPQCHRTSIGLYSTISIDCVWNVVNMCDLWTLSSCSVLLCLCVSAVRSTLKAATCAQSPSQMSLQQQWSTTYHIASYRMRVTPPVIQLWADWRFPVNNKPSEAEAR